jgi:hypothetical protein
VCEGVCVCGGGGGGGRRGGGGGGVGRGGSRLTKRVVYEEI